MTRGLLDGDVLAVQAGGAYEASHGSGGIARMCSRVALRACNAQPADATRARAEDDKLDVLSNHDDTRPEDRSCVHERVGVRSELARQGVALVESVHLARPRAHEVRDLVAEGAEGRLGADSLPQVVGLDDLLLDVAAATFSDWSFDAVVRMRAVVGEVRLARVEDVARDAVQCSYEMAFGEVARRDNVFKDGC